MTEIVMGAEGWADIEEGTEALLQEWHVNPGDAVQEGQLLAVAELVKTTHEIVAPAAGRLAEITVEAGDTFANGAVLAKLSRE